MYRFFDSPQDMSRHVSLAQKHLLPLLDLLDGDGAKFRTALFILITEKAIKEDGLKKERAHEIIDTLFDHIGGEVIPFPEP